MTENPTASGISISSVVVLTFEFFNDGVPVVETFTTGFAVWYGSSESTEALVTPASTGAFDARALSTDTVALAGSGTDRVAIASCGNETKSYKTENLNQIAR